MYLTLHLLATHKIKGSIKQKVCSSEKRISKELVMNQIRTFYQGKRVLVTGGAGFIGSHLIEKLVEYGAYVTVLDNFSTGKLSNLKKVLSNIIIFYADICAPESVMKATNHHDIIFHQAAFASVPESFNNPSLCYKVNVEGTKMLLEGCIKNNVKTFILASSSAVYGNRNTACKEDDLPNPESPYAQSKRDAELLCQRFAQQHNITTACLRYFNVFGPRQDPNGSYAAVVAKFSHNLQNKEPLTIFGDGKQTRDFISVHDVVQANLAIGMLKHLRGEVFNVGSGKSMNLLELVELLEQQLNTKRAGISFLPARKGDIVHSTAYCEKYEKIKTYLMSTLGSNTR
jgi:UDP-glucose 4-epimerase